MTSYLSQIGTNFWPISSVIFPPTIKKNNNWIVRRPVATGWVVNRQNCTRYWIVISGRYFTVQSKPGFFYRWWRLRRRKTARKNENQKRMPKSVGPYIFQGAQENRQNTLKLICSKIAIQFPWVLKKISAWQIKALFSGARFFRRLNHKPPCAGNRKWNRTVK
jgi:hypothetical protein